MRVLIEGESYPIVVLQNIFDDPKFYIQNGMDGKIISVGYYHSFMKNELVYMLPKVFMVDTVKSIFGKTKYELLELGSGKNIKHNVKYNWIRQSLLYFYNSLVEYRKRVIDSKIINPTYSMDLNTNLGGKEYSYLDLLLSFVNFYKKNKTTILYKNIKNTSNHCKKTRWEQTIRQSLPILTSCGTPIYTSIINQKKTPNKEEELTTYFFSILENFNRDHNLCLRIDKSFNIIQGNQFKLLQEKGLSKLRMIRYRYFNDTLKKMYTLCEIYFSQTDKSSSRRRREDFISVNNYNVVFEDMIDKLFSDDLYDKMPDISVKDLKKNNDGKIIDHIYEYQSLMDTSNIFYIGDSKYYKPNNIAGKISKYKQFTYAKNIIQFNIDMLNSPTGDHYNTNVRYRDELTEGYNLTPNFFIYGYIACEHNFDEHLIEKTHYAPTKSYHYKDRLFDRDTLFVHHYRINFLYVLKAYTTYNSIKTQQFRVEVKSKFRNHFIEFFNNYKICEFEFYKCKENTIEAHKLIISENFKLLNGKCYINSIGELILAKYIHDELDKNIMDKFSRIIALS